MYDHLGQGSDIYQHDLIATILILLMDKSIPWVYTNWVKVPKLGLSNDLYPEKK